MSAQGSPAAGWEGEARPDADTLEACDYAGCTRLTSGQVDGWAFCRSHLRDHLLLRREDTVIRQSRGPRPPDPVKWLAQRYGGELFPCQSWAPLLDVMNNPTRKRQERAA